MRVCASSSPTGYGFIACEELFSVHQRGLYTPQPLRTQPRFGLACLRALAKVTPVGPPLNQRLSARDRHAVVVRLLAVDTSGAQGAAQFTTSRRVSSLRTRSKKPWLALDLFSSGTLQGIGQRHRFSSACQCMFQTLCLSSVSRAPSPRCRHDSHSLVRPLDELCERLFAVIDEACSKPPTQRSSRTNFLVAVGVELNHRIVSRS